MTVDDIEITKACADAVNIPAKIIGAIGVAYTYSVWPGRETVWYNPLQDDAKAMLLLYWLMAEAEVIMADDSLYCNSDKQAISMQLPVLSQAALRRAICECVAKIQRNKK